LINVWQRGASIAPAVPTESGSTSKIIEVAGQNIQIMVRCSSDPNNPWIVLVDAWVIKN